MNPLSTAKPFCYLRTHTCASLSALTLVGQFGELEIFKLFKSRLGSIFSKNREIRPKIHDLATVHGSLAPPRGLGPGRDLYF